MSKRKTFAFDAATGLPKRLPAQAALTSTGYVGTQLDQGAATATDMVLVMNIESIVTNGGTGETYNFAVLGSNLANRSDCELLGQITLGAAAIVGTTRETRSAIATDRIVLPFRTEKNDTRFRYVDLRMIVAGTAPSIGFNAYMTAEVG